MLSRHEQQRLTAIEQWFRTAEPELARALSEGPRPRRTLRHRAAALLASLRKPPGSPGR
ncbi:DUF3040 domain-containing protein [Lentzea sp. E54]|uniref:DUF3040 domain-containing protein n=1 Tax=Lentzea xerophila TaxID=3435883 RepID=UPI003DA28CF7